MEAIDPKMTEENTTVVNHEGAVGSPEDVIFEEAKAKLAAVGYTAVIFTATRVVEGNDDELEIVGLIEGDKKSIAIAVNDAYGKYVVPFLEEMMGREND